MGPEERAEVEKRLLNALKQARLEYESAKEEYAGLKIYVADLGETHPDGAHAYRQALKKVTYASRHYAHTLTVFGRFILERKPFP
jgi:hypothetical protein